MSVSEKIKMNVYGGTKNDGLNVVKVHEIQFSKSK